jgi:hypothetical protein
MSDSLPSRPNLGQLRRRAKELRNAVRAGDEVAVGHLRAVLPVGGPVTLSTAQLVIAREYGFASWPRLRAHVEMVSLDLAQRVDAFLVASVRGRTCLAAGCSLIIRRSLGTTSVPRWYWAMSHGSRRCWPRTRAWRPGRMAARAGQPLLGVCMSRWHHIDPGRAAGLVKVAELLLDAGADSHTTVGSRPGDPYFCSTL